MFLPLALLSRLLCFLLSQGSSCYLELEGKLQRMAIPSGLAFGGTVFVKDIQKVPWKNCQSIIITWGSAHEKQCAGGDQVS